MKTLKSFITESNKKDYVFQVPSKNMQPSDLHDLLKELKKEFGDMIEPYPEEGPLYDDNYIQYIVTTSDIKKLSRLAKDFDASFDEYVE